MFEHMLASIWFALGRARAKLYGKPAWDGTVTYLFKYGCHRCGADCREHLLEGPSGGMSTNVFCDECGQGYNITGIVDRCDMISRNISYIADVEKRAKAALEERYAKT